MIASSGDNPNSVAGMRLGLGDVAISLGTRCSAMLSMYICSVGCFLKTDVQRHYVRDPQRAQALCLRGSHFLQPCRT